MTTCSQCGKEIPLIAVHYVAVCVNWVITMKPYCRKCSLGRVCG